MKKLSIVLLVLLFGLGTIQSYGQEVKQEKTRKEATVGSKEKKAAKKASKQNKEVAKGNAYGKNKEAEGKEFGKQRSGSATKAKKN